MAGRPSMIGSVEEHARDVGQADTRASAAALGKVLGLERLGANIETLPPGSRSSLPHAHSRDEEFIFVMTGCPDLWINGVLYRLKPGDAAAFPSGTGIAHCLINNTYDPVQFLVVGEKNAEDQVVYPVNPERQHPRPWTDAPGHQLGPHDGKPTLE